MICEKIENLFKGNSSSIKQNSEKIVDHIGIWLCLWLFFMTLLFLPKEIITNDIWWWFLWGTLIWFYFFSKKMHEFWNKKSPLSFYQKISVILLVSFLIGVYLMAILSWELGTYVTSLFDVSIIGVVIAVYLFWIVNYFFPCILDKKLRLLSVFILIFVALFLINYNFNFDKLGERLGNMLVVQTSEKK